MDVERLRRDFPPLQETSRGRPVVYFDNACMTLKPTPVLDAMQAYYRTSPGCHGRSNHLFGRRTTEAYDGARKRLQRFLGAARPHEVIFTRNATEAINLVASGLGLGVGDVVLTSDVEHNSNLLPWQRLAKRSGVRHRVVPGRPDTTFDLDAYAGLLREGGVKLVSVLHTSNLSGVTFPVDDVVELAHRHGAQVLLDAAQAPLTHALDVKRWGVDYLALSAHKMLGPTGFGLLYARADRQAGLEPLLVGGETVQDTTYVSSEPAPAPDRFEAGLQDYAGAVGAAAAADYVQKLDPAAIRRHVVALNARATHALLALDRVQLVGPADPALRGSVLTFVAEGMRSEDLARVLDEGAGIMVRFGKHCVHSWFNARKVPDTVRVSFGPYNTPDEVDLFVEHVTRVLRHFR